MIVGTGTRHGKPIIVLGVTQENIARLLEGDPILVTRETHSGPDPNQQLPEGFAVCIVFGKDTHDLLGIMSGAASGTEEQHEKPSRKGYLPREGQKNMISKIVEATNGFNWGKFMLCRYDAAEWSRRVALECDSGPSPSPLLRSIGWSQDTLWVLDLQTCEGAAFRPSGSARADLEKHAIWVCPLFEPFLTWLYSQDLADILAIPDVVTLSGAPSALYGYCRNGKKPQP